MAMNLVPPSTPPPGSTPDKAALPENVSILPPPAARGAWHRFNGSPNAVQLTLVGGDESRRPVPQRAPLRMPWDIRLDVIRRQEQDAARRKIEREFGPVAVPSPKPDPAP